MPRPVGDTGGIKTLGIAIRRDLIQKGYVDLKGQKADTDTAEVIIACKRLELNRYLFEALRSLRKRENPTPLGLNLHRGLRGTADVTKSKSVR